MFEVKVIPNIVILVKKLHIMQLAHWVRRGQKGTLKCLWSKTPQWIDNARISQYRTISNYFRTRANNIAAYSGQEGDSAFFTPFQI